MSKKPAKKPAAPPLKVSHLWIKLGDGIRLSAKLWLPKATPVPALIEFSPHRKSDLSAARDSVHCSALAAAGYAVVRIDQRGTGDSEGNASVSFDRQDETDALQALNFISEQKWCDGKLGLFGFAAGGTAALQIARRQPVGLGALIAVAATDDRYEDEGCYHGGVPTAELLANATRQLAISALPQDAKIAGAARKKNWNVRLNQLPFMAAHWLSHPQRGDEWKAVSAAEDLGLITAPVLLVAGWQDPVAGASLRMLKTLRAPCKAVIGAWGHEWPQDNAQRAAIDFTVEMLRWFDQHLKGPATGVMQEPAVRFFMCDAQKGGGGISGRWLGDMLWGLGASTAQTLYLTGYGLSVTKGEEREFVVSSPFTAGFGIASGLADGAARSDSAALTFDSPPLAAELDLAGAPEVVLDVSVNAGVAQIVVRLSAVGPTGEILPLAHKVQNLTHRVSREHPSALETGRRMGITVKLSDMACRLSQGFKLRVSIATSHFPLVWPAPSAVALTVHAGQAELVLPVRRDRGMEKIITFVALAEHTVASISKRSFSLDPVSGAAKLSVVSDAQKQTFSVKPDDAVSARQTAEASFGVGNVRTNVKSSLSATTKHWALSATLEVFEGKTRLFTKTFNEKILRNLV